MNDDSAQVAAPHYRAFISYSHADARFAGWLHRKLETARLPDGQSLAPVFIDRAELVAGPDLTFQVSEALAQSAAVVVIASPSAQASRWVAQEIALFRQLHPDRPILAALIKGEPAEAFPAALLSHHGADIEPLASDFRVGQDGARLGLLKIVAGLSAQPLDRLVQRDAQSRQRRVMAVTAGALLLSLVLSAALVLAMQARADAERQRSEAEGLVEFMLTDLRAKLIGVGRIDVMDAVNQRAMGYYRDQSDLGALPPESLNRRARVIEAMGGDDESRGNLEAAYAKYEMHDRISSTLLARDPDDPNRIFAKAQSENRLALIENTRGNSAVGYTRFRKSKALLDRLPKWKSKPEWAELDSIVSGNLCATGAKAGAGSDVTIRHCQHAIALAEAKVKLEPDNGQARYDLSFHYFWLAEAWNSAGNPSLSQQFFAQSLAASDALIASDPRNMRWREQHMELCYSLARNAGKTGARADFARCLALAEQDAALLTAHDPENRYWQDFKSKIAKFKREKMQ